jgi:glyoxylase-like metal-dependent hydrolase (beta-lactamase superfamily II)
MLVAVGKEIVMKMKNESIVGAVHWRIGDLLVTALSDGYFETPMPDIVRRIPSKRAEDLQREALRCGARPRVTHIMYLVRAPGRAPVLIDAGMGDAWGPTMGWMPEALRALAISPADIGTILLTHLHLDHAAGLTNNAGAPLYPNAELVVAKRETDYWLDEATASRAAADQKMWFEGARKAMAPYHDRTRTFETGEVVPGITAVPLPGHTPGHTGYRLDGGSQSLLVWGDIVHLPQVQAPEPEAGVVFDVDGDEAVRTRRRMLDEATTDRLLIAGMHTEFPGLAKVIREGDRYRIVPELWVTLQP